MLRKCKFILDNLREEDLLELNAIWGQNWKQKVLDTLFDKRVLFAYGKDDTGQIVPIAMGGFCLMPHSAYKIACVWLLSTKYIYINKVTFMKELKRYFFFYEKEYDILYNYIYKTNKQAKKWLDKLGFYFDNPRPSGLKINEGFEFFYKKRKGL